MTMPVAQSRSPAKTEFIGATGKFKNIKIKKAMKSVKLQKNNCVGRNKINEAYDLSRR